MNVVFPFIVLRAVSAPPRNEVLNVGLVAWPQPGSPVVRLNTNAARLRSLHPNLARVSLSGWADELAQTLAAVGDTDAQRGILPALCAPFSADDEPGTASAELGDEDAAIDELVTRLVATPAATMPAPLRAPRAPRMVREIRDWLRRSKLYSARIEDLSRGRVVGQYPINAASDLYVDFALRNGEVHVMETLDLRDVEHLTPTLRGKSALKGITLDEARESVKGKRIALVQASDYGVARPAINLIQRYADELWNLGDATDRQAFATFVSHTLHAAQLPGF